MGFPLRGRFHFPLDDDRRGNTASRRKRCRQFHLTRSERTDQVVQYPVRNVLVKNALIPKLLQIQLQTLQLDAKFIRNVLKGERSEIGLSRLGTHRRKFRTDNLDQIIPMRKGILKCF